MMIDENKALIAGLKKIKKDCMALADCNDCLLYGGDGCTQNIYELGGRPYVWDLSVLKGKEESR